MRLTRANRPARITLNTAARGALCVVSGCCFGLMAPGEARAAKPPPTAHASVVSGEPASLAELPFVVALVERGADLPSGHTCGATQIARDAVVTAAHCVADGGPLDIVTGRERLSESGGFRVPVIETDVHPRYEAGSATYDVAVLRTARELPGRPVGLAQSGDGRAQSGSRATVAGWGLVSQDPDQPSDVLMRADLLVRPDAACAAAHPGLFDAALMLCAGVVDEDHRGDACRGDSGGPLVSNGLPRVLVGIVSGGTGRCGDAARPTVFTEVAAVRRFIAGQIARPATVDPPEGWIPSAGRSAGVDVACRSQRCEVRVAVPTHLARVDRVTLRVRRRRGQCLGEKPCPAYDRSARARRTGSARWAATLRLPVGVIHITASPRTRAGSLVGVPATVRTAVTR